MVVLPDRRPGARLDLPPMPPHASPSQILARALPSIAPSTRMGVTEAAEKYMRVNAAGRWVEFDRETTPYMVEPADMLTSRLYREIVFVGPARSGKTVFLMTGVNHGITCDAGVIHIVHMTDTAARSWVDEELAPMIENSPEIRDRQGRGVSDRNVFSKKFTGGAKVTIGPPVIAQMGAGRTIRTVYITDMDRMSLSINGEGSVFLLGAKRTEIAGSRGMCAGESSPGHPIKDPAWRPKTPHEAPPCDGILDLYNGGTRAHWYWTCKDCGIEFEPRFDRLVYNVKLNPAEAGADAEMKCPDCGVLIAHRHKHELNRAGFWLHENKTGGLVRLETGLALPSDRLSYHLNGAAATFAPWSRLVTKYELALRSYEATGDDEPLKVTVNTDQGLAFLPRALAEKDLITVQFLKDKQEELAQGTAPEWARFIVVGVDVQSGRFVCQTMAFGVDGERAVIDRFDLHTPPKTSPNAENRRLDPPKYIEDWEVLRDLLKKRYPIHRADHALTPMAIGCDFHGEPGVSDNAEKFWHARVAAGEMSRYYMIRGHGGFKVADRFWYAAPTRANSKKLARKIKLLNIATDRFKDTLSASLGRTEAGPAALHLYKWMEESHLVEFTAEIRTVKGWIPKKGLKRNEAIDVSNYALAVAEFKGLNRLDPSALPEWAVGGPSNEFAVALTESAPDLKKEKPKLDPMKFPTSFG